MIGWLYRKLVGYFDTCNHDWELVKEGKILSLGDYAGEYRFWECRICKKTKKNKWEGPL